jgi:hypothetical protein
MKPTARPIAKKAARSVPAPVPAAAELDATLAVIEARVPGLRRAGVTRLVHGALDLRIAPEPPPAPAKAPKDDEGEDDLLAAYRGREDGGSR